MHGKSRLTSATGWIRGCGSLFEEKIPEAFCSSHGTGTGGPFASKSAMMSESIKNKMEGWRRWWPFQKHLSYPLNISCLKQSLFLHVVGGLIGSDAISIFLFWVKKCAGVLRQSAETQSTFCPRSNVKRLANLIGHAASFAPNQTRTSIFKIRPSYWSLMGLPFTSVWKHNCSPNYCAVMAEWGDFSFHPQVSLQ